jgi:hypothetical protein
VRAIEILRMNLDENLAGVHQRRRAALWRAVTGLVLGGQLGLSTLGRALPGNTTDKHRIKSVDRLLGNVRLQAQSDQIYRAMASWLLKRVRAPVIAVDWTGLGSHHFELSAKLCSDGRALPLFSLVFPKHDNASRVAHRHFLRRLAQVLPAHCKPIIITDAGFYHDWFDTVMSYDWHYVGRIRGTTGIILEGNRYTLKQLHRRAHAQPQNLGTALLSFGQPRARRLVLSQEPRLKGRRRLTRRGHRGRCTTDIKASQGAREPWVLATSLQSDAKAVVQLYGLRMQIEQSFRDRKNYRNGWSMRLANTRSSGRMSVLVLIASLADLAVQLAGRAVARTVAARGFQANTVRKHRVLSFFFLGCRALRCGIDATSGEVATAINDLLATLHENALICA